MERNPREAVRNNLLGTWHVAEVAGRTGTGRFVLVSTDKAADPESVMGATKRAAEMVVQQAQELHPGTHYMAVRFGNVLGSNGSVIPLFERQIERGGPVTITHPEVTRFFMTIPEAVQLVLQAGLLEEGRGQIAMLEMGEPLPIVELARNLVRLKGLRPEVDIPFVYTGLRPGEKMHETLVGDAERLRPTSLDGVRLLQMRPVVNNAQALVRLLQVVRDGSLRQDTARALLFGVVEAGPGAMSHAGQRSPDPAVVGPAHPRPLRGPGGGAPPGPGAQGVGGEGPSGPPVVGLGEAGGRAPLSGLRLCPDGGRP